MRYLESEDFASVSPTADAVLPVGRNLLGPIRSKDAELVHERRVPGIWIRFSDVPLKTLAGATYTIPSPKYHTLP